MYFSFFQILVLSFLLLCTRSNDEETESAKTYYEILGVNFDIDQDELKYQYLIMAERYHPKHFNWKEVDRFYDICEAYQNLQSIGLRKLYHRDIGVPTSWYPQSYGIEKPDWVSDEIVGVDYGTTHSGIAHFNCKTNRTVLIQNENDERLTESVIGHYLDGEILVGGKARTSLGAYIPGNIIYDVKRFMGKTYKEITDEGFQVSFTFESNEEGYPLIRSQREDDVTVYLTPEYLGSVVMERLRIDAERDLVPPGKHIVKAVISVPAYYKSRQREAITRAAWLAGFYLVLSIIHEPTAAAYSIHLEERKDDDDDDDIDSVKYFVVYDWGGGTLDITLMRIHRNGTLEELETNGHNILGGEDFTSRLLQIFLQQHMKEFQIPDISEISDGDRVYYRQQAEKAKREMRNFANRFEKSGGKKPMSKFCYRLDVASKGRALSKPFKICLDQFWESCEDLYFEGFRTLEKLFELGEAQGVSVSMIEAVYLAGGSARLPKLREKMKEYFENALGESFSVQFRSIKNPGESIAMGAAEFSKYLKCEEWKSQLPKLPDPPNPWDDDDDGKDYDDSGIWPFGGWIYPNSLGVETADGTFSVVLERPFKIPSRSWRLYTTYMPEQVQVRMKVFEGQERKAKDNTKIDEFVLEGIEVAPRGVPQINVTFSVNPFGVLRVSAVDRKTNVSTEMKPTKVTSSRTNFDNFVTDSKNKVIVDDKEYYFSPGDEL